MAAATKCSGCDRMVRLPYAALSSAGDVLAADGQPPDGPVHSVPLEYGGQVVGELLVGLRPGERELAAADHKVLDLVAAPLAVAVHATWLSAELHASRGRIIAAREEERRPSCRSPTARRRSYGRATPVSAEPDRAGRNRSLRHAGC